MLVVKLDFAKAFNSVNWDSLIEDIGGLGFPREMEKVDVAATLHLEVGRACQRCPGAMDTVHMRSLAGRRLVPVLVSPSGRCSTAATQF